ncbi:MAG: L-lactate dehydrogenase [Anaerolineales bacterium]|nr:L-lactate dehydrogenase [Anaerolineales bacterium]
MKIGIIGSGLVGSTTAYALVMRGIGRDVVLVDKNIARSSAEADDILHAVPFAHPLQIRSGTYEDLAGSRVVVLSAGVNQLPGETRLQLLERNAAIFREIVPQVLQHAPEAVLLVATNPVDVLTHLAAKIAAEDGVPKSRVIGSGTTLDTARFRTLLGGRFGVDAHHVHAYVVGEHGDSEVLTWSLVTLGGIPLEEFCRQRGIEKTEQDRDEIERRVKGAAYSIIEGKGATYYGVASALARIIQVIALDQRSILTVCSRHEEVAGVPDVTLSLPHLIGGSGVIETWSLPIDENEMAGLNTSARTIRDAIDELGR